MENTPKDYGYGYILEEKIYLKGFLDFPDRKIGQVKLTEEASIKYFEDRFQLAKQKVEELEALVEEAQNKGSYLMKLVHMRKYLANFDGLGDYVVLFDKLDAIEEDLRDLISVNRVKNLEIKMALLLEMEELFKVEDLNEATELIKEIKQKWIKTGAVVVEKQEETEKKFEYLYKRFFDKKKYLIKQRSQQSRYRVNAYRDLIFAAENIRNSDDFDETFAEFRNLQNAWKEVGKIPHRKAIEFWDRFKKANDFFFTRYKNFKAFKEEEPDLTSHEIKSKYELTLCRQAEAIVDLDQFKDEHTEQAKELLMDWKRLTNTFRDLNVDISERFRIACDKVFEMSYLMRVVKRKYPDVDGKPKEDRLRIKISFMRELIRKDEMELNVAETNFQKMMAQQQRSFNPKFPPPYNPREQQAIREQQNTLNIQKRKVKVKKQILKELEEILSDLKKNSKY